MSIIEKSLGVSGHLPIIAIGPMGGKIVGYGHGHKPIYAGSSEAKKLEAHHASKNASYKTASDLLKETIAWLTTLGIHGKYGTATGTITVNTVEEANKIKDAFGVPSVGATSAEKANGRTFSANDLLPHVGHALKPAAKDATKVHAALASGTFGEDAPFSPALLAGMTIGKELEGGSHPGNYKVTDANGKQYAFKTGDAFATHGEEVFNRVAKLVSPNPKAHPATEIVTIKGKTGALMEFLHGEDLAKEGTEVSDAKLEKYADQLIQHQMLDWLMGNHDAHSGNFKVAPDGTVSAFDKGQAFKYVAKPEIKILDMGPGNGYPPVYQKLWKLIDSGKIKVDAVKASNKVMEGINKISPEQYDAITKPYFDFLATQFGESNAKKSHDAAMLRFATFKEQWQKFLSDHLKHPVVLESKPTPVMAVAQVAAPVVPAAAKTTPSATDKVVQKPGWPITKGTVTVHNPGESEGKPSSWPDGYPGPGYHAEVKYSGKTYQFSFAADGYTVTFPDGSKQKTSSPNQAGVLMLLHHKGLPPNADLKKNKIAINVKTLLKLGEFADDFKQSASIAPTMAAKNVETLEKEGVVTHEAKAVSAAALLFKEPDGVVSVAQLTPAMQSTFASEDTGPIVKKNSSDPNKEGIVVGTMSPATGASFAMLFKPDGSPSDLVPSATDEQWVLDAVKAAASPPEKQHNWEGWESGPPAEPSPPKGKVPLQQFNYAFPSDDIEAFTVPGPPTLKILKTASVGSHFTFGDYAFALQPDLTWQSPDGQGPKFATEDLAALMQEEFADAGGKGSTTLNPPLKEKPVAPPKPVKKEFAWKGAALVGADDLNALPVGAVVMIEVSNEPYSHIKQDNGMWTSSEGSISAKFLSKLGAATIQKEPGVPGWNGAHMADYHALNELPVGTELTSLMGDPPLVLTKTKMGDAPPGVWISNQGTFAGGYLPTESYFCKIPDDYDIATVAEAAGKSATPEAPEPEPLVPASFLAKSAMADAATTSKVLGALEADGIFGNKSWTAGKPSGWPAWFPPPDSVIETYYNGTPLYLAFQVNDEGHAQLSALTDKAFGGTEYSLIGKSETFANTGEATLLKAVKQLAKLLQKQGISYPVPDSVTGDELKEQFGLDKVGYATGAKAGATGYPLAAAAKDAPAEEGQSGVLATMTHAEYVQTSAFKAAFPEVKGTELSEDGSDIVFTVSESISASAVVKKVASKLVAAGFSVPPDCLTWGKVPLTAKANTLIHTAVTVNEAKSTLPTEAPSKLFPGWFDNAAAQLASLNVMDKIIALDKAEVGALLVVPKIQAVHGETDWVLSKGSDGQWVVVKSGKSPGSGQKFTPKHLIEYLKLWSTSGALIPVAKDEPVVPAASGSVSYQSGWPGWKASAKDALAGSDEAGKIAAMEAASPGAMMLLPKPLGFSVDLIFEKTSDPEKPWSVIHDGSLLATDKHTHSELLQTAKEGKSSFVPLTEAEGSAYKYTASTFTFASGMSLADFQKMVDAAPAGATVEHPVTAVVWTKSSNWSNAWGMYTSGKLNLKSTDELWKELNQHPAGPPALPPAPGSPSLPPSEDTSAPPPPAPTPPTVGMVHPTIYGGAYMKTTEPVLDDAPVGTTLTFFGAYSKSPTGMQVKKVSANKWESTGLMDVSIPGGTNHGLAKFIKSLPYGKSQAVMTAPGEALPVATDKTAIPVPPVALTEPEKAAVGANKAAAAVKAAKFSDALAWAKKNPVVTDSDTLVALSNYLKKTPDNGSMYAHLSEDGSQLLYGNGTSTEPGAKVVDTPLGKLNAIDVATLKEKFTPETVKGPDGKTYPKGTTFTEVKTTTKTRVQALLDAVPGSAVKEHAYNPEKYLTIAAPGANPLVLTELQKACSQHGLVPQNSITGSSNSMVVVLKTKANEAFATAVEYTSKVPDNVPQSFIPKGMPGIRQKQGETAIANSGDIDHLHSIVAPNAWGHRIRIGNGKALWGSQLRVNRVRMESSSEKVAPTEYFEVHGELFDFKGLKAKGMTQGVVLYAHTEDFASAKFDEKTGTQVKNKAKAEARLFPGYNGVTDAGSTFGVITGGPGKAYAYKNHFVIRVPVGKDVREETAKALKAMNVNPDDVLSDHDENAEKLFIKSQVVRSYIGAHGYFDKDAAGKSLDRAKYGDEKWLDEQLKIIGATNGKNMDEVIKNARVEVGPGGMHHVVLNDLTTKSIKAAGVDCLKMDFTTSESVTAHRVAMMLSGEGVISRTNGYANGTAAEGQSAGTDADSGGSYGVFTRIGKESDPATGGINLVYKPELLQRTGWWAFQVDGYGCRSAEAAMGGKMKYTPEAGSKEARTAFKASYEVMFEGGIANKDIAGVCCPSESSRTLVLAALKKQKIEQVNGIPVEDFCFVGTLGKAPGLKKGA